MKLSTGVCLFPVLFAAALHSQELSWTKPEIIGDKPGGPAIEVSGVRNPVVPDQLERLNQIGYAEVTVLATKEGKVVAATNDATSPWIAGAMMEARQGERIHFSDTAAEPFYTFRQHLIYNPRSAFGKHNKVPKLIAVHSAHWPKGMRDNRAVDEAWTNAVDLNLSVSKDGSVVEAKPVHEIAPEFARAAIEAALEWKFEPAHDDAGASIPSQVVGSIVFEGTRVFPASELSSLPVATYQVKPEYPFAARRHGQGGTLVLRFVVNKKGAVESPEIVSSNNDALNDAAITAIKRWRFKPGKRNGEVVNVMMQIPLVFSLNDGDTPSQFSVSSRKDKNLPEALQYDFPPSVKNAVHGVYPFSALQEKRTGKVNVRFLVLPSGRVRFGDESATALTEFDRAARAMLEEFAFTPASKDGKPTVGLLSMSVDFSVNSPTVGLSDSARNILKELKKKEPGIVQLTQIDGKPNPISKHAPSYPAELENKKIGGEALIDFYIDEAGKVQLPSIVSCTEPAMGFAAAQAISEWTFEPMKTHGKPAIVHARIPFKFNFEDRKENAASDDKESLGAETAHAKSS